MKNIYLILCIVVLVLSACSQSPSKSVDKYKKSNSPVLADKQQIISKETVDNNMKKDEKIIGSTSLVKISTEPEGSYFFKQGDKPTVVLIKENEEENIETIKNYINENIFYFSSFTKLFNYNLEKNSVEILYSRTSSGSNMKVSYLNNEYLYFQITSEDGKSINRIRLFDKKVEHVKQLPNLDFVKDIPLNDELQKKINIFFSNFSETGLNVFAKEQYNDKDLISFALYHNILNRTGASQSYDQNHGKISVRNVEETIKRYFGISFKNHQAVNSYQLENDNYIYEYALGNSPNFSYVTKLIDMKNERFLAYADIFSVMQFEGYPENKYEGMKYWKYMPSIPKAIVVYKIAAEIQKETDGRYVLIDYLPIK